MRKINLGKLRCSTHSSSNGHSPSGASTKNQSQATISSFFIRKPCSNAKEIDNNSESRSTVNGDTSGAKGAKRTASKLSQHENNDDCNVQNSKKQRLQLDQSIQDVGKDDDHLGLTNKETLSSSTMAKLSCFEKDSNSKDSLPGNDKMRSVSTVSQHKENVKLDKDDKSRSSGGHIYVDDGDDSEEMEINSSFPQESFNVTKFACTSCPSVKSASKVKGATHKNETEGSKSFNSRTKSAYTPLELQFLEVKSKYSDVILFVECGYRYRFFGEDAEIAAKELNIMCHMDHNFNTASIPTHRLHVHVKRLVSKGYKVGVVKQTETAALKAAGENKSKVFTRELQALYTKTTLVGEDMKTVEDLDEVDPVEMGSGYLMCLVEVDPQDSKTSSDKKIFGLVAVQPSTGDVVFDEFEDGPSYTELESRFEHISPEELLLPESLTVRTENFIRDYITRVQRPEDSIRLERMSDQLFDHSAALNHITEFYDEQKPVRNEEICKVNITRDSNEQEKCSALEIILKLPKSVHTCFAALIHHLKDFKLEKILRLTSNLSRFSIQNKCLKLSGQTLRNLEIFKNQTNGSEKSSLFWVINHTTTAFGRRLLKKWISQPLRDVSEIDKRLDAVAELCSPSASCLSSLKGLLTQLPDLERGLCTIYHKKCTPAEFVAIANSLVKLTKHLQSNKEVATSKMESPLLRNVFTEVPNFLDDVGDFLKLIDEKVAKEGDKTKLFCDQTKFPAIMKCNLEIEGILAELKSHRSEFRQILRHPSLDYCCVAGNEFLIEVRNTNLKMVPCDWIKISATKQVSRFRTPFVEDKFKLLCQWREQLSITCQEAWLEFLALFSEGCSRYRRAVHHIATLDCLFSLAAVAEQPGFTRPVVKDCEAHIYIKQGRHPVLDSLLPENEQFVPNDTHMNVNSNRCMIITGPNMGGKSSYIKQVALISILAQVGSFVPAEEARVGVLDAVFTRMGATDNIYKGQSTFMVELQETSDIIAQATPKSLVILDELGRGTSTHDGMAIAYATLHHFISQVSSLTLFVTHYPSLAELDTIFPNQVTNNHMAFMTSEEVQDQQSAKQCTEGGETEEHQLLSTVPSVTFLYHLVNGAAARSYGLNVARLAGIPNEILKEAAAKSRELENLVITRRSIKTSFQELFLDKPITHEAIKHLRMVLEKITPEVKEMAFDCSS